MRTLSLLVLLFLVPVSSAEAAPCTELPVLFIVQDKSGSMASVPDPVNAPSASSKWTTAKAVVPQLAQQYAAQFRFGVMMYPKESTQFSCTTGTVLTNVPATAAQVTTAYNGAAAGGGTPTAASLQVAKQYLSTLSGTAPKYVLLITDGLPNCNLNNNAATCRTTTAGCQNTSTCTGSSCCGLGAKDCLDDNATVQAAAALKAIGIKTYVVGFGTSVTTANDKSVLDAVAAAGGTTQAYVANNQASLQNALNTIAGNTATCCQDQCTNGASTCTAAGQKSTCAVGANGCTSWVNTSCQAMSACVSGICQACTNACTQGSKRCNANGDAETCSVGANGCTGWVTSDECAYGELCTAGSCNSCQACSNGANRCAANGSAEKCEWDVLTGCTAWKAAPCASGSACANGVCAACNTTCTSGAKRCAGNTTETCVANAAGCTSWQAGQTCTNFCSGGSCGTCGTSCTVGAKQCNGNGTQTCVTDVNNCSTWSPVTACASGSSCANGVCATCAVSCTVGAKRCAGGFEGGTQMEECGLSATGCTEWKPVTGCTAGATCNGGVCVPPCQSECAPGAGKCDANSPVTCEKAPSGCFVWKKQAACAAGQGCLNGGCFEVCDNGELASCAHAGDVCTGLPNGDRLCLPPGGSEGGSGGGSGSATGGGSGGSTAAGGGSGQATGGGSGGSSNAGGGSGAGSSGGKGGGTGSQASPADPQNGDMTVTSSGTGCGCSAGSEGLLPLILLSGLRLLRRRKP